MRVTVRQAQVTPRANQQIQRRIQVKSGGSFHVESSTPLNIGAADQLSEGEESDGGEQLPQRYVGVVGAAGVKGRRERAGAFMTQ